MAEPSSSVARFGWLANTCTMGSLVMCYGKAALFALMGVFGIVSTESMPHIQAVLMWILAGAAILGLARDRGQHGRPLPLALGIAGLVIMVLTLYTYYDWRILTFAYICLISAVFLNQTLALGGLYATVQSQAIELEKLNRSLEQRVDQQVDEIGRLNRLKRFLSPQVARLVTESPEQDLLASHRRYITALFCDLRGFTPFSEHFEPEETMELLQSFHEDIGNLVFEHNGTIDHRAGDGLMVIFNDPLPCERPELETIRLAIAMRDHVASISHTWTQRGYELGFGIGIASGYATMGFVGTEGRVDYTANGNVVNLAARLSDEARNNQILINQRTFVEVESEVEVESLPDLDLKGIDKPVKCHNVIGLLERQTDTSTVPPPAPSA